MSGKLVGTIELMGHTKINWNNELVKDVITSLKKLKPEPILFSGKVSFDNASRQFSINIPKSIVKKSRLKEGKEVMIALNPTKEIREEIEESKLVLYFKDEN